MLGGSFSDDVAIGKIVGPAFSREQIVDAIDTVLQTYLKQRTSPEERFIDCYRRTGMQPFKDALYATH